MQVHCGAVASVKRPIKWKELRGKISLAIVMQKEFAKSNPNLRIDLIDTPDKTGFVLNHPAYPQAKVKVNFLDGQLIEISCTYKKTDDADSRHWEDRLGFHIDDRDQIHFTNKGDIISDDDAALLILAPVRDPGFQPPPA